MTKVTDKLEKSQCQCDDLVGKTIKKFTRNRGYYYLLFEDNTWCHTDYQLEIDEMIEILEHEDPLNDPFIEFGLVELGYQSEHWEEIDTETEARITESRRQRYLELKEEFENE